MTTFGAASTPCPLVAADAPVASAKDAPTTPNTGTASIWRPRFEDCLVRGMSVLPCRLTINGSDMRLANLFVSNSGIAHCTQQQAGIKSHQQVVHSNDMLQRGGTGEKIMLTRES